MAQTTVKAEQIAINAISGTIIADNAITSVHIAQNAILTQHIDDGQVDTAQLADDAVTNAKIADSSVVTAHIQDDQVTGDKLANNITIAGTLTSTGAFTSPGIDDNADAIAITIDSSEKVGIGNTSPTEILTLGTTSDANTRIAIQSADDGAGTIQFADGTSAAAYAGYINYTHSDNALAFATSSTERARIDSSGNVGIGTASPSTYDSRANNLVVGDSGDSGITIFSGASSDARLQFAPSGSTGLDNGLIGYDNNNDSMVFATGGSDRLTIDSSGNLIIPNSYSSVRRIYSSYQSEVFDTTSAGSAETETLSYYFPYMEHTSVFLRVYLTGAGNHSYMYKLSVLNGYYGCTVQVLASYNNAGGTAYADSLSVSSTGNYNTRRLTVAFDAASNVAPSDFTIVAYYGVAGGM